MTRVDTEIRKPVPLGGRRSSNRGANGYENLKTGFVRPAAGVLLTVARMDTKIGDPVSPGGRRLRSAAGVLQPAADRPEQAVKAASRRHCALSRATAIHWAKGAKKEARRPLCGTGQDQGEPSHRMTQQRGTATSGSVCIGLPVVPPSEITVRQGVTGTFRRL